MTQDRLRLAEFVGAASLAADVGLGASYEHGLRSALVAVRLGERAGLDEATLAQIYYVSLLTFIGCTAEGHLGGSMFGDEHAMHRAVAPHIYGTEMSMMRAVMPLMAHGRRGPAGIAQIARTMPKVAKVMPSVSAAHCEVAQMLSEQLPIPASTRALFAASYERWDGKGDPKKLRGEEVPLPIRVINVARDAEWQREAGGASLASEILRKRAGRAHDPVLANLAAEHAESLLNGLDAGSVWDEAVAGEPGERPVLEGPAIDHALEALADFVDLKSPYLREHSRSVAALAEGAARHCGFSADDVRDVRRAALVHDIGRVAVSISIWDQPGPLSADHIEKVRLHSYHSDRVLSRTPLAGIGRVASMHHERLDASGYHRGLDGSALPPAAKMLAAADTYSAMIEPRAFRVPYDAEHAEKELREDVQLGRLDGEAAAGVLVAAGHQPSRRSERAGGLTEREVEVLRLVARGLPTKTIGRTLGISAKTADNHIQRIYAKCGVSTRAAATLFAMRNGLCSEAFG